MIKKAVVLLLVLSLLLGIAGCARDGPPAPAATPLPSSVASPTTRPSPIPTATRQPTPTASPTPRPTRTPRPSPTPQPDPAALLDEAWAEMMRLGTFYADGQVAMTATMEGLNMEFTTLLNAGFHAPDNARGEISMSILGEETGFTYVVIGDDIYLRDQPSSDWYPGDAIAFDYPGLSGADGFAPRGSDGLHNLRWVGEETLHGEPVNHVHGTLRPGTYSDIEATEPVSLDIWIGREDACIYRVVAETDGYMIDPMIPAGEFQVHLLMEVDYRDFGEAVLIAAPKIPQRYAPATSLSLDLYYELPQGWEVDSWGDPDCDEPQCRGVRLSRSDAAGDSDITIAYSNDAAVTTARAGSDRFLYSETMIGDHSGFWCEAEGEAGGYLFTSAGSVVEVRGRWPLDSEGATVLQTVAASLQPLAPAAADYRPYDLPGWLALDLPADWYVVQGQFPGQLALSTRDLAVYESTLAAGDGLVLINEIGNDWEPALYLLEEVYLADMPPDRIIAIPPAKILVNDYWAATATYTSPRPDGTRALEQVTILEGPGRNIVFVTVTKEDSLAVHAHTFAAILNSLQIYPPVPAPQPVFDGSVPAEYDAYSDPVTGLTLNHPAGWEVSVEEDSLILTPPALDGQLAPVWTTIMIREEPDLAAVPPGHTGDLLWSAWEMLWSSLPPVDAQTTSEPAFSDHNDQELGLVRVAMTADEGPLSGLVAVIRQGDQLFLVLALTDDLPTYEEAFIRIISSIELEQGPQPTAG